MPAYAGMTQAQTLEKADSPLRGIFWMLVTGLCFVAVTALVKSLDGRLPAAESAFLRYILGAVFLIPMFGALIRSKLTKRQVSLFGLRGLVHALGVILWFYALARIPIAEVTAMNYMSPIYVTLGAVLLLGERLAIRRILAVGVAFLGALVILRPGFRELDLGHFAMIGAAIGFAIGYLIAKKLSGEVSAAVVVGMLSLMVPIGLAPMALLNWVTPTLWELVVLMGVACFATAGHYTMTMAFQAAPVSVTMPVQFLQLVWSVLLGAVFFAEPPDFFVILGGLLIVSAISFISLREAMLKRA
ncbi:DMT family transporter [Cognatishimia sp. 1_MG-2023]|uniref:DMT family transporter n=1 Tax=Cognatishimia sp. 1_MG-2023 TaxID=3062642 RepID=UPI00387ED423